MDDSPTGVFNRCNFVATVFPVWRLKGLFELLMKLHHEAIHALYPTAMHRAAAPVLASVVPQATAPTPGITPSPANKVLAKFSGVSKELTERDHAKVQRHLACKHHSRHIPARELWETMPKYARATAEPPLNTPAFLSWLYADLRNSSSDDDNDLVMGTRSSSERAIKL
ncbi:hypothetical protein BDU57DRAFT_538726 [Ampelomyces quisqualis]|uniref:Uncharacterized protein n=1 Tax=Ampelomyces quisqualis TaxID=50730 RepID=A0A6A5QNM4_AMPQU|nr:hypothetical protein BDU57DRAFT_538726 [Ampelomyces quisqualis]